MVDRPLISVIIPSWNSLSTIGLTLDALRGQTLDADLFEVIVVDNGSTDGSDLAVAQRADVTLLREPRPGSYAARNLGLKHARGRNVAFTDSDCIPAADWLERSLAALEQRPQAGVVAGPIEFFETGEGSNRACFLYESLFAMRQDSPNGQVATANWMCRKALMDEFGGFRDDLKSGGDHELSGRMHSAGRLTFLARDAIVKHPARGNLGELVRKTRRLVGGKWQSSASRRRTLSRLVAETKNARRRIGTARASAGLGAADKRRLIMLIVTLWTVSVIEIVKLQLGGRPTRS